MSDLRTRIAATIYHTAAAWDQDWPWESLVDHVKVIYLEQADAVIAELALQPVETLDRRYMRWATKWRNNPEWNPPAKGSTDD